MAAAVAVGTEAVDIVAVGIVVVIDKEVAAAAGIAADRIRNLIHRHNWHPR